MFQQRRQCAYNVTLWPCRVITVANNAFTLYFWRTYVAVNNVIHINSAAMKAQPCVLYIVALPMLLPTMWDTIRFSCKVLVSLNCMTFRIRSRLSHICNIPYSNSLSHTWNIPYPISTLSRVKYSLPNLVRFTRATLHIQSRLSDTCNTPYPVSSLWHVQQSLSILVVLSLFCYTDCKERSRTVSISVLLAVSLKAVL